jgi:hypothetical protein
VVLPSSFPEATLFALLKSLFGRPKGFMSLALGLKNPEGLRGDPDAPFKYEFSVRLPDHTYLSVVRSWLNLEVRRFGGNLALDEILRMFTYNFDLHKDRLKKTLEDLEKYRLVINPHFRHRQMMAYFEKELRGLEVKDLDLPKSLIAKEGDIRVLGEQLQRYMKETERQNIIATSLVMESAYTAESFLNLLIAVLQNKTLSQNSVILRDALKESWKDKLLRLSLHCVGIATQPKETDQEVRDLDTIFKLRNKIAHSYPDPDDLCVAKIWFDDRIPLLPRAEAYVPYQHGADAILPRRLEALECPPKAQRFMDYLLAKLSDEVRPGIIMFAKTNPIGYSEKTGRFGIPFSGTITMSLMG